MYGPPRHGGGGNVWAAPADGGGPQPPAPRLTAARLRAPYSPYFSRSSTLRTLPDTVIGKESSIRSRLGIL